MCHLQLPVPLYSRIRSLICFDTTVLDTVPDHHRLFVNEKLSGAEVLVQSGVQMHKCNSITSNSWICLYHNLSQGIGHMHVQLLVRVTYRLCLTHLWSLTVIEPALIIGFKYLPRKMMRKGIGMVRIVVQTLRCLEEFSESMFATSWPSRVNLWFLPMWHHDEGLFPWVQAVTVCLVVMLHS